ncbi:hypothetical protein CBR_g32247 [Chara braunii]|uniref:Protein KTI12 homolog n=1 Tax=Chara braunii TaxID=69332 RepID=A0A388JN23_CHABU|nr:hypothetical protein CBR_g32247 [Chara braunii]|eukprot:GBG59230.1 hypothetical protein CBR_g32247 [Chara braunii]
MALVVICGQPCSGKTTVADLLVRAVSAERNGNEGIAVGARSFHVSVIGEHSLHVDRNDGYQDMVCEKNVRGLLRSAVDRAVVGKDKIVIVDSLNNIKGYRYELWCLARAAGTRYCMVHCDTPIDTARRWNKERAAAVPEGGGGSGGGGGVGGGGGGGASSYHDEIFDDLVRRFERPDGRNRWDSPLFTIRPDAEDHSEMMELIAQVASLAQGLRGAATAVAKGPRNLQPTIATQTVRLSETNVLYEMDKATQEVIIALISAQQGEVGGLGGGDVGMRKVDVGQGLPPVNLHRPVGLPELRRHRRTFLKLTSQTALTGRPPPTDTISAKRMFLDYLNREIAQV